MTKIQGKGGKEISDVAFKQGTQGVLHVGIITNLTIYGGELFFKTSLGNIQEKQNLFKQGVVYLSTLDALPMYIKAFLIGCKIQFIF